MYNYVMLIGRICSEFDYKEFQDGKKRLRMRIAIRRGFQNSEGAYDTDFLTVTVWDFNADYVKDTFKVGDMIGIKGRVSPNQVTLESGASISANELIGERVITFGGQTNTNVED